jgi:hypothetical protein
MSLEPPSLPRHRSPAEISFFTSFRRNRAECAAADAAASHHFGVPLDFSATVAAIRHVKPDRILSEATAVKAVTAAGAFWAAFGHLLS